MKIEVGGGKKDIRELDVTDLYGYIERSGAKIGRLSVSGGDVAKPTSQSRGIIDTEYLVDRVFPKNVTLKYANTDLCDSLAQEMGRTRRLERSINKHIPQAITRLRQEIKNLDSKKPRFHISLASRKSRLQDTLLKLKEYKWEWKYRKMIVYNTTKHLIPKIYILRREKYNRIQAKWRFMGREQPRIHLGMISEIGGLSDDKLKEFAVTQIRKKFIQPLDTLTMKWIKDENTRLQKWADDMGYKIKVSDTRDAIQTTKLKKRDVKVKIPKIITQDMRLSLQMMGYSDKQIKMMTPKEAMNKVMKGNL